MADRWMLRGVEYGNCNCNWGCPCQFGAPTTHGNCEAVVAGHIEEGSFNETKLDGLDWALLLHWPGEIADGNGTEQAIIDERADPAQREALRRILHGESTTSGMTHFFVYNSTMSSVLETLYAPIELSIDVDVRMASMEIGHTARQGRRRYRFHRPVHPGSRPERSCSRDVPFHDRSEWGEALSCRVGRHTASLRAQKRAAVARPPLRLRARPMWRLHGASR